MSLSCAGDSARMHRPAVAGHEEAVCIRLGFVGILFHVSTTMLVCTSFRGCLRTGESLNPQQAAWEGAGDPVRA